MPNCTKCGARVEADDEFCPDCGTKIRQPTEALPAREAQKIVMQQAQPKKHRFLTAVVIIIVIIFLFRACTSFSSEPQIPSSYEQYAAPAPSPDERMITIETPPPRVNPIPEPEPLRMSEQEKEIAIAACKFACTIKDKVKYDNPGFSESIVKAGFNKCADFLELGGSYENACIEPISCSSGGEQIVADFKSGGATTANFYSGLVPIVVAGTGQSSGIAYNDAFYVFTSYSDGSDIMPEIMDPFLLYIDNQPAPNVAPVPEYNPEHNYAFTFDAGSIPRAISFRVGDGYTADNSGAFAIKLC